MGFHVPVSQDGNAPTHTVESSPSPGAYAALSLITPWWRNTWAHMSADVFVYFCTERGNMFHNKCLHTLKQIFFKKEKKRETETLAGASWRLCSFVSITQPWKESTCLLGRVCAEVWVSGGRTRMECASWDSQEEKSQWVRGKNSQNPGRESKTKRYKSPQAKGQELGAGRIQEIWHQ